MAIAVAAAVAAVPAAALAGAVTDLGADLTRELQSLNEAWVAWAQDAHAAGATYVQADRAAVTRLTNAAGRPMCPDRRCPAELAAPGT